MTAIKNRTTVEHGMLPDLEAYLLRNGWKLEPPVGTYEVLRARRPAIPGRSSFTTARPAAAGTASTSVT